MIEKIVKPAMWKILGLFYGNRNKPLHLREIARQSGMKESSISPHLMNLVKSKILIEKREANLRRFSLSKYAVPIIFPLFDYEKLESLPLLRKNCIKDYLEKLASKPVFILIFGSTAKNNYTEKSDIDIMAVFNSKSNNSEAIAHAEAQTGVHLQEFQITEKSLREIVQKKSDHVILSALETGFPVFNDKYYYEEIYNGQR
jgi:predicted nucleotidyltransferase